MKRTLALAIAFLTFSTSAFAMDLGDTLHLDRTYINKQTGTAGWHDSVNLADYSIDSKPTVARKYLEAKDGGKDFVFGKQSFTLGNGLVAGISEVCGVKTSYMRDKVKATLFYGNNGQPIFAGTWATTREDDDFSFEAAYFKIDEPYMGLTFSGKLGKNDMVNIETSENLVTLAKGYLIRMSHGQAERAGDISAAVSYRFVESGAVSSYSADADLDDSKGVRLETTYKFSDDLSLTFLRDFATTQDNLDKNAVNATLTWDF